MKLFLSMAAAVLMISSASAQHSSQHSAIGIKGGVNIYNINLDNDDEYDSKIGFNVGLLGHIHVAKQLALQPEITYSLQGAKFDLLGNDAKINLSYVNVPVLLQYMFNNGFRIQAGPQVGFLVNAKTKYEGDETDIKDELKTVDFGIGAGLSYVHPSSGVGIDARYNFGLSNINETDAVKARNRGAQIGIFYLFNHK